MKDTKPSDGSLRLAEQSEPVDAERMPDRLEVAPFQQAGMVFDLHDVQYVSAFQRQVLPPLEGLAAANKWSYNSA